MMTATYYLSVYPYEILVEILEPYFFAIAWVFWAINNNHSWALTNTACNNCASPSSSADQISAKWKGKKWKILIIRDIDFLKMRVQSADRIYSRPYATHRLNRFTLRKWITYTSVLHPTEPVNFTHFQLNAYNIIILFKILGYIKNSGKYRL